MYQVYLLLRAWSFYTGEKRKKDRRFINISFSSFWSPTALVLGVQLCPKTHEGGSEIFNENGWRAQHLR